MTFDKSARTYIRRSAFNPLFLKPDASRDLSQLRSVANGILDLSDAWIGQLPSYDVASTPVHGVDAKTLHSVVAAIRRSETMGGKYRLGLDLNPAELRGQDQQIVLLNSSELRTKVSDITRGEL